MRGLYFLTGITGALEGGRVLSDYPSLPLDESLVSEPSYDLRKWLWIIPL